MRAEKSRRHRNRLRIMRAFYSVQALTTMVFALSGALTPLVVFIITGLMGLVRASDLGVRAALVAHNVPSEQLMGALIAAGDRLQHGDARVRAARVRMLDALRHSLLSFADAIAADTTAENRQIDQSIAAIAADATSLPEDDPIRAIAGRVVDGVTGEPVRRATVAALAEEDREIVRSAQTDADGRFSIERLPAGKYPLTASKRGFRASFYDEHDEFNSAIVTGEGQNTVNLEFRLAPGAVLHGVVTADGGDAAEQEQPPCPAERLQQSDVHVLPSRTRRSR